MSVFFPKPIKFDASDYDPSQRGGKGFDIEDYQYLVGQGVGFDKIKQIANSSVDIGPKAQQALNGVPSFPTMDSVFADWNRLAFAKYNTYADVRTAGPEAIKAQLERLVPELEAKQKEWLAQYGDTPEGQAILKEPPPTWESVYLKWQPLYEKKYGAQLLNRPWYADEDAANQKKALDQAYIDELKAYNERNGTNFQPSTSVLGKDAQPNIFVSPNPKKEWYENPVNLLALGLGAYGLYSLATAGTAGVAGTAGAAGGAAGGTGLTIGSGGVTGLTAGSTLGLTAPAGFTLAPGVGATVGAGALATEVAGGTGLSSQTGSLLDSVSGLDGLLGPGETIVGAGQGATVPTAPGLSSMGGGTGILAPVEGGVVSELGLVPTGATPVLGDQASFINNPDVLGNTVFTEDTLLAPGSASGVDALDVLKQASKLVGQTEQPLPQPDQSGGMSMQGGQVDYSGLLNLLALQANRPQIANLLAPAQLSPQYNFYSLLG